MTKTRERILNPLRSRATQQEGVIATAQRARELRDRYGLRNVQIARRLNYSSGRISELLRMASCSSN